MKSIHNNIRNSSRRAASLVDWVILFFIVIILFSIYNDANKPTTSYKSYKYDDVGEIDVSKDPEQTAALFAQPIIVRVHNIDFKLFPQANYKISGIVLAKNTFFIMDAGADLAPIDVGLAWGKMAEPEYDKYMSYSSQSRFLQWNYNSNFPFTFEFLNSHVSHNHIIPAGENILKAVKSFKNKEKVYLEGYLVNVESEYNGGKFTWNTSLSRYDKSAGACEVFYVKKVRIGNNFYE